MTVVTNHSYLSPAMRRALIAVRTSGQTPFLGTRRALEARGYLKPRGWAESRYPWPKGFAEPARHRAHLTPAGRRIADELMSADESARIVDSALGIEQDMVRVSLPLAEAVSRAWETAYASGDNDGKPTRFRELAEAIEALRKDDQTPVGWLTRILLLARAYAEGEVESWERTLSDRVEEG